MTNILSVLPKKVRVLRKFFFSLVLGLGLMLSLGLVRVSAQGRPVQVSYDVEFSTTGVMMSRLGQCNDSRITASGYDKLSGTIVGLEPAPKDEDTVYEGKLMRETDVTECYVATNDNGVSRACQLTVKGRAEAWFQLTLEFGGRGANLKLLDDRPVKVFTSSVTGTCDVAEMADIQREYGSMSTGGSPDGQPINVVAMPRTGPFPKTFAPLPLETQPRSPQDRSRGPSAGDAGIWALTVRGRRP